MECDFGRKFLSVTDIRYDSLVARMVVVHLFLDGGTVRNLLAADGDNHIALLQSGLFRGASLRNLNYIYAVHGIKFQIFLNFFIKGGNGLHGDAEHGALDGAEVDQVAGDALDDVHRDGEGIAGVGTGLGDDGGVDAHQLALLVHEGAAGVAGIHGRIGLDEGFDLEFAGAVGHGTALRGDNTGGDGASELLAERGADGEDPLAEAELVAVAHRDGGQVLRVDLDDGDVRGRVGADDGGVELLVVVRGHRDLGGAGDDVVVGDDVAVGPDDDAGPAALRLPGLGLAEAIAIPEAEEVFERVDAAAGGLLDRHFHVDDRLHGGLSGIGEIRVIGFCQIDSTVFDTAVFARQADRAQVLFIDFHDAIGGQSAGEDGKQYG